MRTLGDTKRRLLQVKDQIITAYKNNWTLRSLAEAHDTSPGSIRNLLIEQGVQMRESGRRRTPKYEDPNLL